MDKVFAIIGPIQGDNGKGIVEIQDYRREIAGVLKSYLPSWSEYEPHLTVMAKVREVLKSGLSPLENTRHRGVFVPDPCLRDISKEFLEATGKVGHSDLVVCYLPGRKLSMGTAMELYSSKLNGAIVITVTDLTDNIAILSTSDVVTEDCECLGTALQVVGLI